MNKEDKELVDGFFRWCMVVGVTLNLIIWGFIVNAHCQSSIPYPVKVEPKPMPTPDHLSLHNDQDEFEDSIGVKFIAVTSQDDSLIYYYVTRKFEQRLSSVGFDKYTIYQNGDAKKPKGKLFTPEGCFMMMYCKTHLMAYVLSRIPCKEVQTK